MTIDKSFICFRIPVAIVIGSPDDQTNLCTDFSNKRDQWPRGLALMSEELIRFGFPVGHAQMAITSLDAAANIYIHALTEACSGASCR